MKQTSGPVTVDEGDREAVAGQGSSSRSGPGGSRTEPAAGAWGETLGRWGMRSGNYQVREIEVSGVASGILRGCVKRAVIQT
jgi:hypothetical protein